MTESQELIKLRVTKDEDIQALTEAYNERTMFTLTGAGLMARYSPVEIEIGNTKSCISDRAHAVMVLKLFDVQTFN